MSCSHRDNAQYEVYKFLKTFYKGDLTGKQVLEIGQGNDEMFKKIFLKYRAASYECVDKEADTKPDYDCNFEEFFTKMYAGDHTIVPKLHELKEQKQNTYDIVFACHSFEHSEHPTLFMENIKLALRVGGHAFLITPHHCREQVLEEANADWDHINVVTLWQMKKYLQFVGLHPIGLYTQSWIYEEKKMLKVQDWNLITIATKEEEVEKK